MIGKRLMTFGVDGVYVFQGVRSRVTKHIYDGWLLTPWECIVWLIESILRFKFYFAYQG